MDAITSALSGQTTSRLVLGGVIGLVLAKKLLLGRGHAREPSKTALGARVVLITGCDSGFGRGLVEAALAEGFEVVSACYTQDGAAALEGVTTVVADLATPEGVEAVVRVAKEVAGARGLYGLVNNAGRCVPGNCGWAVHKSNCRGASATAESSTRLTG